MQMQSYRTGDSVIRYCEIAKMLRSSFTYVADISSDILSISIIFSNVVSRDLNCTNIFVDNAFWIQSFDVLEFPFFFF